MFILAYAKCNGEKRNESEHGERGRFMQTGEDMAHPEYSRHVHGQSQEQPAEAREPSQRDIEPEGKVADSKFKRLEGRNVSSTVAYSEVKADTRTANSSSWTTDPADLDPSSESHVGRVADGISNRVDRIKCLGNAVVPSQAERAWEILTGENVTK